MKDLIMQYEFAVEDLRAKDKEAKLELSFLEEEKKNFITIGEYETNILEKIASIKNDRSHYSSMISDLKFAIEWMKTGRKPGLMRGAENLAAYQREIKIDPNRFLNMQSKERESKTDKEIKILEDKVLDLLWFMTKRERAIYMLANGYGFSVTEISNLTNIATGTVYSLLDRARKKIKKNIKVEDFFE
ncbi:sigma factor-like helix-turn-helix DNA-binding protein [Bacillus weihaiensis]|uniref:sigma factor-like helix-turn-helix DNA-binding protein n=1 Tax=Bacillus weihaiensis TaxID=1547283 RepID=UPI0023527015|nr:sigma factor-like helix-turn-helix DNA-binding protein [Bacillus weihaiensis]